MTKEDPYLTRKTLIQRVRDQYDEKSWEEFAGVYTRYIYAIIRRMNINSTDAEDIHQKVLMKLWNALPNFDPEEMTRFRSFLSTVTRNCVMDFIRQRTRQANREDRAASTMEYLDSIRLPDIEDIAEREWEIFLTNMAFKKLDSSYSEESITVLKMFLDGADVEEIEAATNLSTKQVYNIRFRMKNRFISEIKKLRADLE